MGRWGAPADAELIELTGRTDLGSSRARSLIDAAHSRGGMETARNLFKMIGEEGMHSRRLASRHAGDITDQAMAAGLSSGHNDADRAP